MKVLVKSKSQARTDSYKDNNPNYVIISISTPGDEHNVFAKRPELKDILYLSFHDIGCRDSAGTPMSYEDGAMIADFIMKWKDKVEEIWVHCDAGISRSSGVAAAILRFLTGSDAEIYDNPRYCPNFGCYKKTLVKLLEKGDIKHSEE